MYKYVLMFLLGGICAYILSLIFQPNAKISKSAENKAEAIVLNCRRQFIPDTDYIPDVRQRQLVYQSNECIKKSWSIRLRKFFLKKNNKKFYQILICWKKPIFNFIIRCIQKTNMFSLPEHWNYCLFRHLGKKHCKTC